MTALKAFDNEELVALIALCAVRDQQALKALYQRTGAYLNAVAFRIVRSIDASHDVLQEAFIQIWQNASEFRSEQALALTWLSSIVRYRAIDRRERDQRIASRTLSWTAADDLRLGDASEQPEQKLLNAQLQAQLQRCLTQLNPRMQTSIRLAYLYGYSRDELARHFDTNVNTIKSWLHRGAEALKLCLQTTATQHHD